MVIIILISNWSHSARRRLLPQPPPLRSLRHELQSYIPSLPLFGLNPCWFFRFGFLLEMRRVSLFSPLGVFVQDPVADSATSGDEHKFVDKNSLTLGLGWTSHFHHFPPTGIKEEVFVCRDDHPRIATDKLHCNNFSLNKSQRARLFPEHFLSDNASTERDVLHLQNSCRVRKGAR